MYVWRVAWRRSVVCTWNVWTLNMFHRLHLLTFSTVMWKALGVAHFRSHLGALTDRIDFVGPHRAMTQSLNFGILCDLGEIFHFALEHTRAIFISRYIMYIKRLDSETYVIPIIFVLCALSRPNAYIRRTKGTVNGMMNDVTIVAKSTNQYNLTRTISNHDFLHVKNQNAIALTTIVLQCVVSRLEQISRIPMNESGFRNFIFECWNAASVLRLTLSTDKLT